MNIYTILSLIATVIASIIITICGMIEMAKHYKDNLASLGYKLECHYIEVDGVRSNWCELVSIKKK